MSQTTQSIFSIEPLPDAAQWDEFEEKLDDALDKSFPASDPISLGCTHHIGQPRSFPRTPIDGRKGKANFR